LLRLIPEHDIYPFLWLTLTRKTLSAEKLFSQATQSVCVPAHRWIFIGKKYLDPDGRKIRKLGKPLLNQQI
jgi:hypothetical protein